MNENIRISVIIPIYNTEEYLEECLESILAQTVPFYEIILINDGSTDKSAEICKSYCVRYSNIRLVEQSNQGQGNARNRGIQMASGDYIVFIDSDDKVFENMNETIIKNLSQNPVDVLYFSADIKDDIGTYSEKNDYIRRNDICDMTLTGVDFFVRTYQDNNYIVSPCLAAYDRSFIVDKKITFPTRIVYEDIPFFLHVTMCAQRIRCVTDKLYIRRYRKCSTTTGKITKKKCQDHMTMQCEVWKILKANNMLCEHRVLIKKYIICYVLRLKNMLEQYGEATGKEADYVEDFIRYWGQLWNYENIGWNDIYPMMCLRKLGKGESEENSESCRLFFAEVEKKAKNLAESKLKRLPLQERRRIGIYGLGKHTEVLLKWYEDLIGAIGADIYFIASQKTMDTFWGKIVIGGDAIPFDTDAIIISSKRYEEEMISTLRESQVDFCEIITIYDPEDEYDLPAIDEVLQL